MKLHALLHAAEAAGILSEQDTVRVAGFVAERNERHLTTWYLHALIAVGAWFSAGFFLAFLFAALGDTLFASPHARAICGLVMIAGAAGVRCLTQSGFLHQICLVNSVVGHVLVFTGVAEIAHGFGAVVVAGFVLAGVLYLLYPDSLHRFLSSGTALALFNTWFQFKLFRGIFESRPEAADLLAIQFGFYATVLTHCLLLGWIFLPTGSPQVLRPLGYATAISLLVPLQPWILPFFSRVYVPGWPVTVILAAALLFICIWAAGGWDRLRKRPSLYAFIAGGVLLVSSLGNPALLVALGFLVLGFALQDKAFITLGALLLPFFLTIYYYSMEITLLRKSLLLIASGLVLLALRAVLARIPWDKEEVIAK